MTSGISLSGLRRSVSFDSGVEVPGRAVFFSLRPPACFEWLSEIWLSASAASNDEMTQTPSRRENRLLIPKEGEEN
jgi:hypothetical protein